MESKTNISHHSLSDLSGVNLMWIYIICVVSLERKKNTEKCCCVVFRKKTKKKEKKNFFAILTLGASYFCIYGDFKVMIMMTQEIKFFFHFQRFKYFNN